MHACVCVGNIHFRWTIKRLHGLFSFMFMCRTFDFDTYFSQHCAFLEFSAKIFQLRSTSHSLHICFTWWICCRGATYQTQIKLNLFNLKYFLVLFVCFSKKHCQMTIFCHNHIASALECLFEMKNKWIEVILHRFYSSRKKCCIWNGIWFDG